MVVYYRRFSCAKQDIFSFFWHLETKCGLLAFRDAPVGVGSLSCLFSDLLKCQIFPLADSIYLFVCTFTFSYYFILLFNIVRSFVLYISRFWMSVIRFLFSFIFLFLIGNAYRTLTLLNKCHLFFFFTFVWPCIVTNSFIIKPTRCANFTNLFWNEWNSTCFGQFLCPSSGVHSLYTQQWFM